MAAALVVAPSPVSEGKKVTITGTGFTANTMVDVFVQEYGIQVEVMSDEAGRISSASLAADAAGVLTSSGVQVTAADTVTIDGVVYTFRAAVAVTANEVLIGANAAASLANLKAAINADPAGSGITYGSATVVHPTVGAGVNTATTLRVYAKVGGVGGNALATTKVAATLTWGGATLSGGAAAASAQPLQFIPNYLIPFTTIANDGTNVATVRTLVTSQ